MKSSFAIIPDITCDLSAEIRQEYNIDFVAGHFTDKDGNEIVGTLSWDFSDRKSFYSALKKNPAAFKTFPPNVEEFKIAFESYVKEDVPIICPVISSKMSGTYRFAQSAVEELLKQYPNAKIAVIDSLRFSAAVGLMAVNASQMRDMGMSFEETVQKLESLKLCYHQMGYLDDLPFAAKQGRINNAAAFFGTLLGIKPLGDIDTNGMTTVVGKAKGEKSAIDAIINYVRETAVDISSQTVIVCHSDREKSAQLLKERLQTELNPHRILETTVFPSCGISIGSGLMAVYYVGKEVSENLEKEKLVMQEFLGK